MGKLFAFSLALGLIVTLGAAGESLAPMALNSLSGVPSKIVLAKVIDTRGKPIGSVLKIETDKHGKPLRVEIWLNSGKIVTIDASALGYDDSANILVTALRPHSSHG